MPTNVSLNKLLIQFTTTYLCESGFSAVVYIKMKNRNQLDAQHDMRITLSKIIPQFNNLIQAKQQNPHTETVNK